MKIFVNLPTWLGDSVMASAALRLIFSHYKKTDPNTRFVLFGSFVACELFKECENVAIFIQTPKKKNSLSAWRRFYDFYKLTRIWGEFDCAFSFRSAFSAQFMLFILRAKHKFIFDKKCNKDAHQVLKYLAFIENALDTKATQRELFLPIRAFKDLSSKQQKALFDRFSLNADKKFLGINAGAKYGLAKCWEKEYFAKVALEFSHTHEILIFGTNSEQEICDDIESWLNHHNTKAHNLCGKTSIKDLCELISALHLFISNDSGAMHIAAVYKTPTIAIFGPTKFTQTSPWQNENASLVHLNLTCMPCMKRICPLQHHACMKELKPKLVINAINSFLTKQENEAKNSQIF